MGVDYRIGDILRVACPPFAVEVREIRHDYVVVTWPWWTPDPDADGYSWDGGVAIACPWNSQDGADELFRTDPPPQELHAGDVCHVGIPPTVVQVIGVELDDPPRVTGLLPRPTGQVRLLRAGVRHDPDSEFQGCFMDLGDGVPTELVPVFRPFAFLTAGDEVADAAGRAWHFTGAWDWRAFDGAPAAVPLWPLRLLTRGGREDPEAVAEVAAATATGAHADEIARWSTLAGTEPAVTDRRPPARDR